MTQVLSSDLTNFQTQLSYIVCSTLRIPQKAGSFLPPTIYLKLYPRSNPFCFWKQWSALNTANKLTHLLKVSVLRLMWKMDHICWDSQVAGNMRCIGCRANRLCEWKIFTCVPYRAGGSKLQQYPCRPTIYDTALVAMLFRTNVHDEAPRAIYPEAFRYLLDHQQTHGGWTMGDFTLGTLLNTMAGLLVLSFRPSLQAVVIVDEDDELF